MKQPKLRLCEHGADILKHYEMGIGAFIVGVFTMEMLEAHCQRYNIKPFEMERVFERVPCGPRVPKVQAVMNHWGVEGTYLAGVYTRAGFKARNVMSKLKSLDGLGIS